MTTNALTRRQMLQLAGGFGTAGLAGCVGALNDGNVVATDATTATEQHDEGDGHDEEGGHQEADGHHHEEDTVGEPTAEAEVTMFTEDTGFHFDPHVVRVTEGGTVRFVNESGSHTATAYHPDNDRPLLMPENADAWDSEMLTDAGAEFEHTFETEGVYHYFCAPHESAGMIGSVIVGEPDAHGQPALEEPPEELPDAVREKIHSLNEMCNEALGHTH